MKTLLLCGLILAFSGSGWAQMQGWIFLIDKDGSFMEADYFDAFAVERKQQLNLPVGDYFDLPVSSAYVRSLAQSVDTIYGTSRWLNAVAVSARPAQWTQLMELPMVEGIWPFVQSVHLAEGDADWPSLWPIDSMLLEYQTRRLGRDQWQSEGFTGKGVRVGVVDGGFTGVDTHPAFRHMRDSNRIIAAYDFLQQDSSVYGHHRHGTAVLSCIAGRYGDSMLVGLAPDVSVVLARTERGISETIEEELAWISAIEWMDKFGVSIVNSSLGYTDRRYFEEDMDGRTSPIVRAANLAVKKGILIINAAGNEGDVRWGTIGTPADGDSVLSVGATDPYTDHATRFSSPGPTADGRLKPNVSAPGIVVAATPRDFSQTGGTSFSAPLVTGFAACMLQHRPALTPMQLLQAIEQSGHLFPFYDYHHGYGIPQASKVLGRFQVDSQSFVIQSSGNYINIVIAQAYIPERDDADNLLSTPKNIYYHIENAHGNIRKYQVVAAEEEEPFFIEQDDLQSGDVLRVHFEGLTKTYTKP